MWQRKGRGLLFGWNTLVLMLLALLSTLACVAWQLYGDLTLTLLGTAVIFPIVFAIHGAYERREMALAQYAALKANGRAIFIGTRDWPETSSSEALKALKALLHELMLAIDRYLQGTLNQDPEFERTIYQRFDQLSSFVRLEQRQRGVTNTELSRTHQYFASMLTAFENIKHIHQYRTPLTLKRFSDIFVFVVPILYAPYFAQLFVAHGWLSLALPVIIASSLTALSNIQQHLENPFDQVGEDDVRIRVDKFVSSLQITTAGESGAAKVIAG